MKQRSRVLPRKGFRRASALAATALFAIGGSIGLVGALTPMPGEVRVENGAMRNQSFYLEMKDRTRIAIDIWYPEGTIAGNRAPTLMHMTRYWRARETTFTQRILHGLGLASAEALVPEHVRVFNARGYIVIEVDARGSGASFGSRVAELGPQEIDDYGQIANWIARQGWSNGRVGTFGISYNGNAAELALVSGSPAIKAVAPQFSDFDFQFGVLQPGGATMNFVPMWGKMVKAMDANDICAVDGVKGLSCLLAHLVKGGVKPVDGPDGSAMLGAAIDEHQRNAEIETAFANVRFRDDKFGSSAIPISQLNSYGHREAIEASGTPMQVWTGWFDAGTTAGTLSRYVSFANPQHLIIGPFAHGGAHDTDPLRDDEAPPIRTPREQYELMASFFDRHLKTPQAKPVRAISYYTMGKGRWCRTAAWPPSGVDYRAFYFGPQRSLSAPPGAPGRDQYRVDFSQSSGTHNRWMTNLDYGDVVYEDRGPNQSRVLSYTSSPLSAELIITGTPRLRINLASDRAEFTVHAYLEGVAPDGRGYHIAEAILRSEYLPLSGEPDPADIFGSGRSFLRKNARLPATGAISEVDLSMTPVSIAVSRGHRLRVVLAGADAAIFPRYPQKGDVTWTVHYGAGRLSALEVPVEGADSCVQADPFSSPER